MGYSIRRFAPEVLGTSFDGNIEIRERFEALEALDQEIQASNPRAVLIDLSNASMCHYGASDALEFSKRIGDRPRPLRKIAYVLRPSQSDMLVSAVSGIYGTETVRRFASMEKALTWLDAPGVDVSKET